MAEAGPYRRIGDLKDCVAIVAHPDDETIWAGGTMLLHPEARWTVVTVCRKSDEERAEKFFRAMEKYNATGLMGDMDDGPEQSPLVGREVRQTILSLLPGERFDLIITHGPWGEYTRHLRHEETSKGVTCLCKTGKLTAEQIWMFAYEDGGGKYLPRAVADADIRIRLTDEIRQKKYDIITQIYGFGPESFEARAAPRGEAFWIFKPT